MLSRYRNKKAAKQFFKQTIENPHVVCPRVITKDKSPTFPPALSELQDEGIMPSDTKLRPIKYLNNSMENDHKFTKSRYRQCYQSFDTARRAICAMEPMRMIQKGQLRHAAKADVRAQNKMINKLFGLAA